MKVQRVFALMLLLALAVSGCAFTKNTEPKDSSKQLEAWVNWNGIELVPYKNLAPCVSSSGEVQFYSQPFFEEREPNSDKCPKATWEGDFVLPQAELAVSDYTSLQAMDEEFAEAFALSDSTQIYLGPIVSDPALGFFNEKRKYFVSGEDMIKDYGGYYFLFEFNDGTYLLKDLTEIEGSEEFEQREFLDGFIKQLQSQLKT